MPDDARRDEDAQRQDRRLTAASRGATGIESGTATGWVAHRLDRGLRAPARRPRRVRPVGARTRSRSTTRRSRKRSDAVAELPEEREVHQAGGVKSIAVTSFQEGGLRHPRRVVATCTARRASTPTSSRRGPTSAPTAQGQLVLPAGRQGSWRPEGDAHRWRVHGDHEGQRSSRGQGHAAVHDVGRLRQRSGRRSVRGSRPTRASRSTQIPAKSDQDFAKLLLSSDVARFDGSDSMPGAVGSGTFWKQATAWITGESTDDFLKNVNDQLAKVLRRRGPERRGPGGSAHAMSTAPWGGCTVRWSVHPLHGVRST